MVEWKATYKCRLCGEVFESGITGDGNALAISVALTVKEQFLNPSTNSSGSRYTIHNCSDGSIGFADFQGFKKSGD